VVLLYGKELFLRTHYTAALRAALEQAHGKIETFRFDGTTCSAAEVLDECRSFGLMSTHKMVVVDDADSFVNADTRPLIQKYAEAPNEQSTLVLRGSTWHKGNLDKAIGKVGVVIKCDAVDEGVAGKWVIARAKRQYGVDVSMRVAAMLVDRLGTDLGRIDGELGKLATAAGDGGAITEQHVAELVGLTREEEVWSLQSHLLSGNLERTIRELRVILGNGAKDTHVPAVFACSDLARKLVGASEGMARGVNANTIAKELRLWGESRDVILHAAKRAGAARSRRLFDRCIDADLTIKSSSVDPRVLLERLAVEFAMALR
jgi:DNA polymerase-3 subunit delta